MAAKRNLFLLLFFAYLTGFYLFIAWNPINDKVIVPYTRSLARVAAAVLSSIGTPSVCNGTTITSARFAVDVNNGCNGVEALLILVASILAFPASAKARALGIVAGSILIEVLNEIRIVTLVLMGIYNPRLFQIFHTAVWQILLILVTVAFFIVWSGKLARPELAHSD
ncbi:MAG TPA: exosortase H [Thermoanaerobaculia bacterium]|nr:exosortase H [Thermoanaerobaculia bacterium]